MKCLYRVIALAIISSALCAFSGSSRALAGEGAQEKLAATGSKTPAKKKLKIFVSILPQQYFVERIGGDRVEVEVLVPPGQSPATYSVTAKQMARLAHADVLFISRVPFENALLPKIKSTMKKLKIVDPTRYIRPYKINGSYYQPPKKRPGAPGKAGQEPNPSLQGQEQPETATAVSAAGEAAPPDAEKPAEVFNGYQMEDRDPHTWMAPLLAKAQVYLIYKTLVKMDPAGEKIYTANLDAFNKDIMNLHQYLYEVLRPMRGKMFVVFHPAFGYFARAYGLWQLIIEEQGKPPSAKRLAGLIDSAKRMNAKIIFVQKQFDHKAAQTIADELGGSIIEMDPLAKDYIQNLRKMGEQIKAALSKQQPVANPKGAAKP